MKWNKKALGVAAARRIRVAHPRRLRGRLDGRRFVRRGIRRRRRRCTRSRSCRASRETSSTSRCSAASKRRPKAAGATVTVQGPEKFDPTLQKPIVDAVVASKPDVLLIAPTDVTAMQAPIQAAADAGIKVVLVDTTLEDPSMAVSQIASDNIGGGAAAFDAIKEAHPEGGKVLVVSVDPGISTTDARAEGFEAAVAEDSTFHPSGVQYSHNEPATAAEIVTAALQKDPDIVGIFAANLFAAEGSATGVKQAGKEGAVTDRRLRRRTRPGQGPEGRHRPGPRRPGTRHHRRGRRRPSPRRPQRRHPRSQHPDRLHHHHRRQRRRRRRRRRLPIQLRITRTPTAVAGTDGFRPPRPHEGAS